MNKQQKFLHFVSIKSEIKNILVFRNGLLGDTIFITSLLKRLHYTYPCANIDVIVGKNSFDILKYFPGLRTIIPFKYNFSVLSIAKQIGFFLSLISNRYDLMIIPEVNPHYTIVGKFCLPKKIASFANPLWLSDYKIDRPKQKALLAETELVKYWTQNNDVDKPIMFIAQDEKIKTHLLLKTYGVNESDKILFFNPGSSKQYSEKDWAFENYIPVANYFISKYGYKIIFNGLKRDKKDFEKLSLNCNKNAIFLSGDTAIDIRSMCALISISDCVLGVDTGPIHIATALDVPVLCLMGYMDSEETGPYNPTFPVKILTSELPCIPCVHSNPKPAQWEICKTIRPVECMNQISVSSVISGIENILNLKQDK